MDEVSKKRVRNYLNNNRKSITGILSAIKNRDRIIKNQESFTVDSLKSIQRMKELLYEMYKDEIIILCGRDYLTIFSVNDTNKLFNSLNHCLINSLGEEYRLTVKDLVFPRSLGFTNGKKEFYLFNYSDGFIDLK